MPDLDEYTMEVFRRWLRRWEGANGSLVITIEESVRNRARRRAKAGSSPPPDVCEWRWDEGGLVWICGCDALKRGRHLGYWQVRYFPFCPYCGRPLVEVKE
jgi:hypothetical protein